MPFDTNTISDSKTSIFFSFYNENDNEAAAVAILQLLRK